MGIASRIEASTPADRDRYLDFLRVFSILLVVLGHWTVRVVTETDGRLESGYLLARVPAWQWATLVWQVMPIFFLVGGAVNAASWRRARARGECPVNWVRQRARRLLYPMVPLLAVLVPAAALIEAWIGEDALLFDFSVAAFPLWFLGAYMAVTALTPVTLGLHERTGGLFLIVLCMALAVVVDALRFTVLSEPRIGTQPAVGGINFVLVWIVIHQVGYLWADRRVPGSAGGQWLLVLAGAGCLAMMIGPGPYPLSMVPIEGTFEPNNAGPPSAALVALGLVQLGLVLRLQHPVTRLLERPRCWAPVAIVGGYLMTVYLWHQPVLLALANLLYPLGWMPVTEAIDPTWWALRPLWWLVASVTLAAVVLAAHRFERPTDAAPVRFAPATGIALCALGIGLVVAGIAGLIMTRLVQTQLPLNLPWASILALAAGLVALGVIGERLTSVPADVGRSPRH